MLSNWTKATTTTTGTGTLTLTAVTGRPLPSASRAVGEFVQYSITTGDGKYESGIGKIAATETLERSKIFATYDGTTYNNTTATALSLASGTHDVFLTVLGEATFEALPSHCTNVTTPCVTSTHLVSTLTTWQPATAQKQYAWPFRLETCGKLTHMGVHVTTAQTGSAFLLGLYEAGSAGVPVRRIAKTSATLAGTSTGWKSQAVDAQVRLTPGWYWAAFVETTTSVVPILGASLANRTAFGSAGRDGVNRAEAIAGTQTDLDATFYFPAASTNTNAVPLIGLILA